MRPSSSMGIGKSRASPTSTSSPPSSRASSIDNSVDGSATCSTTTFDADSSRPASGVQSTWMSSPPLNCFLAAARTASLIASITRSRSMPCSWHRASMFCAMLVLIYVNVSATIVSNQVSIDSFALPRLTKFAIHINFQICLRDRIKGNLYASAGSILDNYVAGFYPGNPAAEISLVADCRTGLNFCGAAGKPFVLGRFIKAALKPGRRNLQRVGRVDEILDVQHGADLRTDFRAIVVRYAAGLINEHSDDRVAFRTGNFGMDHLKSVVDRSLLSNFVNAFYD